MEDFLKPIKEEEHETETGDAKREGVRAVERAADILKCLGEGEMALSEISKRVGVHKTTVMRMLTSLENKGFVRKDKNNGKYSLHGGLLRLIHGVLNQNQGLVKVAYPVMEELWKKTRETITLMARRGFERVCIAELPSPQPLKYTVGIGLTIPLYVGSPGKLILAYMKGEEMSEYLKQVELDKVTEKTITDKASLLKELELIKQRGWATSFGEYIKGVSSLSVPIFDQENTIIASINLLGPYDRLGEEQLLEYLDDLKDASRRISNNLGF